MADAVLSVEARLKDYVTKNLDKIKKSARDTTTAMQSGFGKVKSGIGNMAKGFMNFLGPIGRVAAAAIGFQKALQLVGESMQFVREKFEGFESSVSRIEAILQPTIGDMKELENTAVSLGKSTVFSASQVSDAMTEMAKLGFNANQIIAASDGVLSLAASAQVDMATAASVTVATLNQFGLEAGEANRVVDIMAKSFTTSALDMGKFSEAMKMAGPIAGNTGTSVEELTGALAVLADSGIDASLAGTAMRRIMLELADANSKASQTVARIDPQARTLAEKFKALGDSGMSATEATELFSLRATTAAQIMAKNADAIDAMTKAYQDADGSAKAMADTMLDNVAGATKLLESAQEGLAIAIGEAFSGEKRDRIQLYTDIVNRATEFVIAHRQEIQTLAAAVSNTIEFLVKLGAGTAAVITGAFDTLVAGIFSTVEFALKGIKKIGDGLNWVMKAIGQEDQMADLSALEAAIEAIGDTAQESADKAYAAFTGKDFTKEIVTGAKKAQEEVKKISPIAEGGSGGSVNDSDAIKMQQQIDAAKRALREANIQAIRDDGLRQTMLLQERHQRELDALGSNLEARKILIEAHEVELETLQSELTQRRIEREKNATEEIKKKRKEAADASKEYYGSTIRAGVDAFSTLGAATSSFFDESARKSKAFAVFQQGIAVARAIMSAVGAAIDTAKDTPGGVGTRTAAAAAVLAELMTMVGVITTQKFARGGSFITNGSQNITVGDNPGGRELVTVTPLSSRNYAGPGTMGGTSIDATSNITINGSASPSTITQIDNMLKKRNREIELAFRNTNLKRRLRLA